MRISKRRMAVAAIGLLLIGIGLLGGAALGVGAAEQPAARMQEAQADCKGKRVDGGRRWYIDCGADAGDSPAAQGYNPAPDGGQRMMLAELAFTLEAQGASSQIQAGGLAAGRRESAKSPADFWGKPTTYYVNSAGEIREAGK